MKGRNPTKCKVTSVLSSFACVLFCAIPSKKALLKYMCFDLFQNAGTKWHFCGSFFFFYFSFFLSFFFFWGGGGVVVDTSRKKMCKYFPFPASHGCSINIYETEEPFYFKFQLLRCSRTTSFASLIHVITDTDRHTQNGSAHRHAIFVLALVFNQLDHKLTKKQM